MIFEHTFLHIDSSESLAAHMEAKFEKMAKFELKPMDIQVVYSMHKHECLVDVTVLEGRRKYKAQSTGTDFYKTVDNVVNKLARQMSKDKRKLKAHKNPEKSHYGQIARLTPELEHDFKKEPFRKAN